VPKLTRAAVDRAGLSGSPAVSTGVDVVGDIAIVKLGRLSRSEKRRFGGALLKELRNVNCVFEQEGGVEGEFRLRKLVHLAGERRTLTTHRENGCVFKVDVAKCYFSPRLSTERLRVARLAKPDDRVLNMFAGVGPFSIPIARMAGARVTSCDLSAYACELHSENNGLNKVERLVRVKNADASELPSTTRLKFDRVIMPHPSQADRFLSTALELAKKGGTIHYYRHVLGRDDEEAFSGLARELSEALPRRSRYSVRKVREVGPRWLELVADVRLAP
jgi:tRNA (guanine37-N1)-methyltransferase